VVSTALHRVRLACGTLAIILPVTTGRDTGSGEPLPGTRGLATVAAHGEGALGARAAGDSVLRGQDSLGITGGNAVSVIESLGRAESPARAAIRLVTHHASDGGALGPGINHVERLGDLRVSGGEQRSVLHWGLIVALLTGENGAEVSLHISDSGVSELAVSGSSPGGLHVVDLVDHLISDGKSVVISLLNIRHGGGDSQSGSNNSSGKHF